MPDPHSPTLPATAFIGFGEAASAFATGWHHALPGIAQARLRAYDRKSDAATTAPAQQVRSGAPGVTACSTPAEALAGAEAAFCLVTADQALAAAQAAAPHLDRGALWFDGNSCAPSTKRQAAAVIEAAGGRYVDLAIMAPVYPSLHRVPLLVSGPHAAAARAVLATFDMVAGDAGDQVGRASSIKMIRSVMVKGLEALMAECFLAARRAGVEDAVIASLADSHPGTDWRGRGAYNLERMMVHGTRRAAEMREVARTVADLGLGGTMSAATADWQARVGALGMEPGADDLPARADAVLAALTGTAPR
jgi:3-hydroxyisobutyrate dehydrogenase-like beta-hydroxyacid dehydrogenase